MDDIQGEQKSGDRGDAVFPVTLMPPDGQNATCFTESLMKMLVHDSEHGQHLTSPLFLPTSPMQMAANRNMGARLFLDETDADYLLFVDSDMGWDPDAVDLLLDAADPMDHPVIGALCFGLRKEETNNQGGFLTVPFPTIYDWRPDKHANMGFVPRYNYSPGAITQASATGAAFLLIHRNVLTAMRKTVGDEWFTRAQLSAGGQVMGEDISFCARLGQAGIPLFVHTGVKTTHAKTVWVGEDFYQGARVLSSLAARSDGDVENLAERVNADA